MQIAGPLRRGARTATRSPLPPKRAAHLSTSTPGSMSRSSWPAASTAARSSRSASDGRRAMSSAASAAGKMCFSRTSALASLCGAAASECQKRPPGQGAGCFQACMLEQAAPTVQLCLTTNIPEAPLKGRLGRVASGLAAA